MSLRTPGIPNPESRIPATGIGDRELGIGNRSVQRCGFTLLELIVSVTVLVVVMGILVQLTTSVQRIWRRGNDVSDTARTAQRVLDLLASDLAAAVAPQFSETESGGEAETSSASTRSPLVFALSKDTDATPPFSVQEDCEPTTFSRILFTSQSPRPVWGSSSDEGNLPIPSRRESGTRLRSVLGVQYRIVDTSETEETDDSDSESDSETPIRFSLVRTVAGLEVAPDEGAEAWWESLDDLPGEPIARNVVWFSVTVPDFLSGATNETGTLEYEYYHDYATRSDESLDLPSDTETGPLPVLVDVALGLLPERDLLQVESLEGSDREELLRMRTRVYTRRIALHGN